MPAVAQTETEDSPSEEKQSPRKRNSGRHRSAGKKEAKPAAEAKTPEKGKDEPRTGKRRAEQSKSSVLGMGEHTPDFLRR